MERKQLIRFWLLLLVSCLSFRQGRLVLGCSDGNCPGQSQIDWLTAQQDPNADLVNSFEDGKDFAWTVDQALAVIAFTHAGEMQRAKRVLDKMKELQPSDCNASWNEWYRLADPCNMDWDWGSLKYVTGPIAWMVIAINYYESNTSDANYVEMARKTLCWLDTMIVTDPAGALRFCDGPRCGQYNPGEPNWISTEHNLDAYSAYYWRGILDANDSYLNKANLILDYLREEMWAPSPNSNCCREINVFCRGYNDCEIATDCQSWGVLSLGPVGPDDEQFYKSLCWLLDPNDSTRTVQDYNESITDVNGYRGCPGDNNYIEVDFTEHVAAAFYSIGDDFSGDRFHNQMRRIVNTNGGLVHSFCDHDPNIGYFMDDPAKRYNNLRYNYVGSVAWHYFNEVKINPFILPSVDNYARASNINKEYAVDFLDLKIFASEWLENDSGLASNIDGIGMVNLLDYSILAKYWLCGCYD